MALCASRYYDLNESTHTFKEQKVNTKCSKFKI